MILYKFVYSYIKIYIKYAIMSLSNESKLEITQLFDKLMKISAEDYLDSEIIDSFNKIYSEVFKIDILRILSDDMVLDIVKNFNEKYQHTMDLDISKELNQKGYFQPFVAKVSQQIDEGEIWENMGKVMQDSLNELIKEGKK